MANSIFNEGDLQRQIPEVVDNLTTNDGTKALSAKQGKALNDQITTQLVTSVPFQSGIFECRETQTIGGITIPTWSIYNCKIRGNDGVATVVHATDGRMWTISGTNGAWSACESISDQIANVDDKLHIAPTGYRMSASIESSTRMQIFLRATMNQLSNGDMRLNFNGNTATFERYDGSTGNWVTIKSW